MANRDMPTPHMLDLDRDPSGGPDLPLTSIPSVPGDSADDPERRSASSHVLVGGALFVLIVAISVLGARYLKLPRSPLALNPAEEHHVDGSGAVTSRTRAETDVPADSATVATGAPPAEPQATPAAAVPQPAAAAPVLTHAPPIAPPPSPTADTASSELASARRELAAKTKALFEARRDLQHERELRKAAERRGDAKSPKSGKTDRTAAADKLDRKGRARLQDLEKQVAVLRRENTEAKWALATRAKAAGHQQAGAEAQARAEAAADASEKRAHAAEGELQAIRASHEAALQGESDAVRKLMADLNAARGSAAAEKTQRIEAERKARSLESDLSRVRSGSAAGGSTVPMRSSGGTYTSQAIPSSVSSSSAMTAPPPAPARAERRDATTPPAGDVREPERLKTTPPSYPDDLRRAHIGGRVLLRLLVDESGRVEDVQVTRSPNPRLSELASSAARHWTYTPGRRDGIRAKVWITEAVDFKL